MLKRAASGMKINSAGDDASGYAISEKMRVKLRALGQCKENTIKGKDMIETASAAVDQQVNIMKQIKLWVCVPQMIPTLIRIGKICKRK